MKRKGGAFAALLFVSLQSAQAGEVQIVDSTSISTSSLSVEAGQTLAIDFRGGSTLNLSGDLHNDGSIYIFSSSPGVNYANIQSSSVFNSSTGVITTVLPVAGIAGVNAASVMSLSLTAARDIVNYGTISSAGNST